MGREEGWGRPILWASTKPPQRFCPYCGKSLGRFSSTEAVQAAVEHHATGGYCQPDFRSEADLVKDSGRCVADVRRNVSVYVQNTRARKKEND
jgi:hypothetical protein